MGYATARLFVAEGARVVIGDVLDDAAHYVHLDVSSEQDWTDAVAAAEQRMSSVNVLLNNGGIVRFLALDVMTIEIYTRASGMSHTREENQKSRPGRGCIIGRPKARGGHGLSRENVTQAWGSIGRTR